MRITAGQSLDALGIELPKTPVDAADTVSGAPATGLRRLTVPGAVELGTVELGIWEITPGVVTDVESDETFVVIAGSGMLEIVDGPVIALRPGIVVALAAGMRTRWTIVETLRKIYLA